MNLKSELHYRSYLNQKFGKLLLLDLIYDITKSGRSRYNYKCQCDCGNVRNIPCWYILDRKQKSCGCSIHETTINYESNINQRFGNLIILELRKEKRNNDIQRKLYYKCQCDCGNIRYCQVHSFHLYKYSSCGCKQQFETNEKYMNMVGEIINDLTIVEYLFSPEEELSYHRHKFRCKCKCGNDQYIVLCSKLIKGNIINCSSCFTSKSRDSYIDLLEYCEHNYLELVSEFTSKSSPVINSNGKVSTIYNTLMFKCLTCNTMFEKTLSPSSTLLCPTCNSTCSSTSEQLLHNFLSEYNILYSKQLLQSISLQKHIEIDFLINNKIGIELHGLETHATTYYTYDNYFIGNKPKNYHLNKLETCNSQNIDLLQFWNIEIVQKFEIVKSIILNRLNLSKYRGYARNCTVKEIDKQTYDQFMINNHIQGTTNGESVRLGLFYNLNENLVSVMSFGHSRYDNYQWELYRFVNQIYCNVVGAASKLFAYFVKTYNPKSIISYSDRRLFNNGKLYDILGFKLSHISDPGYWYFNRYGYDKTRILYHRSVFMKHKLKDILSNFDSNLSEWENMELNNYLRIYDCGNKVYSMIR